tara:strand:+ start:105 stop:578 length:474 start_codon:yes stop_codon:yes gene_type:complete
MNIGVVVENLGMSQLAYSVINNINMACEHNSQNDYVLFYENMGNPILPVNCAIMNSSELWSFNGVVVATTASSAKFALKAVNKTKKFFYIWDLEWTRERNKTEFTKNLSSYRNESISLIARSKEHALAIQNYCNRKVPYIMEDFDINKLEEIIENEI